LSIILDTHFGAAIPELEILYLPIEEEQAAQAAPRLASMTATPRITLMSSSLSGLTAGKSIVDVILL